MLLAACVNEYFSEMKSAEEGNEPSEDRIYKGYKAVLDSKTSDETLVAFFIALSRKLYWSWIDTNKMRPYTS